MTGWVRIAIVGGDIANLLAAAGIGFEVARQTAHSSSWQHPMTAFGWTNAPWLCPLIAGLVGYGTHCWARARLPRPVSAATGVLALHVATLAIGLWAWFAVGPSHDQLDTYFPVWAVVPPAAFGVGVLLVLALAAVPRRGTLQFADGLVRFVLLQLLCIGTLLPFAARYWPNADRALYDCPAAFAGGLLAASAAAAASWVFASERVPFGGLARASSALWLIAAVIAMPRPGSPGWLPYTNMVHVLVGGAGIALAGLVAATIIRWRLSEQPAAGSVVRGRAIADSADGTGAIGRVEFVGWLRGMRAVTERFRLETKGGPIEIPAGTRLAVQTPVETALLAPGQARHVVFSGAEVEVSGLEARDSALFRTTAHTSAADLVVHALGTERDQRSIGVLLWLWRPLVVYIAATTLVALPAALAAVWP